MPVFRILLPLLALLAVAASAQATVVTVAVPYTSGGKEMEGYLAYDDAIPGKRPAVLVVHEWKGLGEHVRLAAQRLAALGYVAMAADMFGKGVYARDNAEAKAMVAPFYADRNLMRSRARDALEALRRSPQADPDMVAATGYCFGGSTVLEMARAGTPLRGVVSFHGGLATPAPAKAGDVKCPVLALHGAEDPHVKQADVTAFMDEMRAAKADWQVVQLGGAVHSFTNREANDLAGGAAYDARADARSWQYMQAFLREVFGR